MARNNGLFHQARRNGPLSRASSSIGRQQLEFVTDTDVGDVQVEREIVESAGLRLGVAHCRTMQQVVVAAQGADALLVQFAPISSEVLEKLPGLRVVVRYGTGLDNVDVGAAMRAGVDVQGADGLCTGEVADHTMALLTITRGINQARDALASGRWPLPGELGTLATLEGVEVALIGFGRIGRAVARRASDFGITGSSWR
jgi:D-3-phosphoglycerate dehydrogenase